MNMTDCIVCSHVKVILGKSKASKLQRPVVACTIPYCKFNHAPHNLENPLYKELYDGIDQNPMKVLSKSQSDTNKTNKKKTTQRGKRKMEDENQSKLQDAKFTVHGEIELPSIDVTPYIGKDAVIEEIIQKKGQYGYAILMLTNVVDTIERADGKDPIELRGTKLFGLQEDKDGNIGWGAKTKLGLFLKKHGKAHYDDCKGMDVTLQSVTRKDERDYLEFI